MGPAAVGDLEEQRRQGFDQLTSGWAIGTIGWKRALAREYSHLKLDVGMSAGGVRELNEARWCDALAKALRECGQAETDLALTPPSTPWKIAVASTLRRESAAPFSWIAQRLHLGNLNTLRSNVRRWQRVHPALACPRRFVSFVSATLSVRARGTAMDEIAVNARSFLDALNKKADDKKP